MNGKHAAEIAKMKASRPDWRPYRWEVVGESAGLLITGDIKVDEVTRSEQVLVTADEIRAFEHRYEVETGSVPCATAPGRSGRASAWERFRATGPVSRSNCDGGTLKVGA